MQQKICITSDDFRDAFPEFMDSEKYSDAVITSFITQAKCYMSPSYLCESEKEWRTLAIELLVAHFLILNDKSLLNEGAAADGGQVASKSVGSVSISFVVPTSKSAFDFWLNQTMYGQRFLALLSSKVPAGVFIPGKPFIR